MIERDGGAVSASCDGCTESHTAFTGDWQEALAELRQEGWRIRRGEDGEWEHHCPGCVEEEQQKGLGDGPALPKGETW